ncbi:MAG: threonylcarbamoyl-AMP synthase [Burkholderiales bacterium]|nr:threonylcarbamoyl-AMP synthase [Burkholderiales bacterium]
MGHLISVLKDSPQPHKIAQAASLLKKGEVAAVPTDTGFSLVCHLDDKEGLAKIRLIRQLSEKKHFTLLCSSLGQMSKLARFGNGGYRLAKSLTPGPYTFILEASKEVPRRLSHPSKKTIGLRVPSNKALEDLINAIGEPLVGTTLIMPGEEEPLSEGWQIQDRIGEHIAFVLDDGTYIAGDTTVVDLQNDVPVVIREGMGSTEPLGL